MRRRPDDLRPRAAGGDEAPALTALPRRRGSNCFHRRARRSSSSRTAATTCSGGGGFGGKPGILEPRVGAAALAVTRAAAGCARAGDFRRGDDVERERRADRV